MVYEESESKEVMKHKVCCCLVDLKEAAPSEQPFGEGPNRGGNIGWRAAGAAPAVPLHGLQQMSAGCAVWTWSYCPPQLSSRRSGAFTPF